jgi:hypothetical protein
MQWAIDEAVADAPEVRKATNPGSVHPPKGTWLRCAKYHRMQQEDLTFYEVSAQVIPALLIVLAFQVGVLPMRRSPSSSIPGPIYFLMWLAGVGYLVLLARAEWTALRVLRDNDPSISAKGELTTALIFELWVTVLAGAVAPILRERNGAAEPDRP